MRSVSDMRLNEGQPSELVRSCRIELLFEIAALYRCDGLLEFIDRIENPPPQDAEDAYQQKATREAGDPEQLDAALNALFKQLLAPLQFLKGEELEFTSHADELRARVQERAAYFYELVCVPKEDRGAEFPDSYGKCGLRPRHTAQGFSERCLQSEPALRLDRCVFQFECAEGVDQRLRSILVPIVERQGTIHEIGERYLR